MEFSKQTSAIIIKDFELEAKANSYSEDELLELLASQIARMMESKMEYLLSLMYRMDVKEEKVNFALSPLAPEPPATGLARLVLERQKQRLHTKKHFQSKPPPTGPDEAWEW